MSDIYESLLHNEGLDASISRLAAMQHGVFSRSQAIDDGATAQMIQHRLRLGRWLRLHPGVYCVAGAPETWRQQLMAACLLMGPGAFVSHLSAAAMWPFPGFKPEGIEVSVTENTARGRDWFTVHRVRDLPQADVTRIHGIPVTNSTRTLLDIAGHCEEERFEIAFDHCFAKGMTSLPWLEWRLNELGRRSGSALVRELIAVRRITSIPQSPLESKALRGIRTAALPLPVCQYPIKDRGRLIGVVDFAYPDVMLAIEADGYAIHFGRVPFEHDRSRLNALTALGWTIVFLTDRHLDKGIERLKALFNARAAMKN